MTSICQSSRSPTWSLHSWAIQRQSARGSGDQEVHGREVDEPRVLRWISPLLRSRLWSPLPHRPCPSSALNSAGRDNWQKMSLHLVTRGNAVTETWNGDRCKQNVCCPGTRCCTRKGEPPGWVLKPERLALPFGKRIHPASRYGLTYAMVETAYRLGAAHSRRRQFCSAKGNRKKALLP